MCSFTCCGTCCGSFSMFGLIFLLCIGGIIDSGSHSINIAESSRADAANNAYVGAAIYAAFVGASIIMYFFGRWRSRTLAAANASAQPLLENRY